MSHRHLTKKRLARLAALAALAMLSGPFGAAVHYTVVAHGVCLEHGETVHVDRHGDAGHAEQAHGQSEGRLAATPTPHLDTHSAPSDRPASDEHAHCDLLATLNHSAVFEAPAPVFAPVAALAVAFEPPAPAPRRALSAVYRFAPKTSPPCGDAARV